MYRFLIAILGTISLSLSACTYDTYETQSPAKVTTNMSPIGQDEYDAAGGATKGKTAWQGFGDLITGNVDKTAFMQADFDEAAYYTVQFSIDPPPPIGGAQSASLTIATIEFSVEGNTITRQVTVGNGVSISAPGQAIKVVARDATTVGIGHLGDPYKVFINVTKGTRPSENQPVTLLGLNSAGLIAQAVAPGGTLFWNVPQSAGAISYQITAGDAIANASPNGRINQGNGVTTLKSYKYTDSQVDGFISLAPNATQVSFQNMSVGDTYIVSLTWGIDG